MVSSSIFKVFGMTRPGIEPRYPGPLANTLTAGPMSRYTKDTLMESNQKNFFSTWERVGWKVHSLTKILTWKVTKWALFFNIEPFEVYMLLPLVLQCLDSIGKKKDINNRFDFIKWNFSLWTNQLTFIDGRTLPWKVWRLLTGIRLLFLISSK